MFAQKMRTITGIYSSSLNTLSFFPYLKLLGFLFVCLFSFTADLGSRQEQFLFLQKPTKTPEKTERSQNIFAYHLFH